MGHIFFATIMTLIVSAAIYLLCKLNLFEVDSCERMLKIVVPENLDYTTMFDDIFKKYTKKIKLEKVKTINMGSLFELSFHIILNKNINEKEFLDEIRIKNGNLKIILSHELDGTEM